MFGRKVRAAIVVATMLFGAGSLDSALAAPWDTDMYRLQSYKANEMARSPVPGTVPLGYVPFNLNVDEAAAQLTNPMPFSSDSVWRGRRLWNSNCFACHGKLGDSQAYVGGLMKAPNLLSADYKARPDGRIFFAIHNGLGNMPRYGFKFSPEEHWDLVNYLRFLQGRDVEGVERPK